MSESSKNSKSISDTLWVIALTAATYSISFSYEAGYAGYFNIPLSMISVSTTLLLTTAGSILISIFPIYAISNAIFPFLPRNESILSRKIRNSTYQILTLCLLLSPHLIHNKGWLTLLFFSAGTIFFEFIFPLITHRSKIPYNEKIILQSKINTNANAFTFTEKAIQKFGRAPILFFIASTLAAYSANTLGNENAKSQEYFLKTNGKPDAILLRQYDNTFITQTIDMKSKKIIGYMKVTRLGDGKEMDFSIEKIGPITSESKTSEFSFSFF